MRCLKIKWPVLGIQQWPNPHSACTEFTLKHQEFHRAAIAHLGLQRQGRGARELQVPCFKHSPKCWRFSFDILAYQANTRLLAFLIPWPPVPPLFAVSMVNSSPMFGQDQEEWFWPWIRTVRSSMFLLFRNQKPVNSSAFFLSWDRPLVLRLLLIHVLISIFQRNSGGLSMGFSIGQKKSIAVKHTTYQNTLVVSLLCLLASNWAQLSDIVSSWLWWLQLLGFAKATETHLRTVYLWPALKKTRVPSFSDLGMFMFHFNACWVPSLSITSCDCFRFLLGPT